MKCSKCGYERQSRDNAFVSLNECPACGIVYAKHDSSKEPANGSGSVPAPHLKPSPVDALSLRKARERVEKRLRERNANRVKDERHTQTLELAKRLTAEQIRKRRSEWKETHSGEQAVQPPAEKAAPVDATHQAPALEADNAPAPGSAGPVADQISAGAQTEKMTLPKASSQKTVASPSPGKKKLPAPAVETQTVAEPNSRADEDALLLNDVVTNPTKGLAEPEPAEPPRTSASAQPDMDETCLEPQPFVQAAQTTSMAKPYEDNGAPARGFSRLLPIVAWLILCAGVIGAVLSWTTIGGAEAGVRIPIPESLSSIPLGLLLGFAYLATGVLGFAFFWVSSLMSIQLRDIHRLLRSEDRGEDGVQGTAAEG